MRREQVTGGARVPTGDVNGGVVLHTRDAFVEGLVME